MDNYSTTSTKKQESTNTFLKIMGDISHLFGNEVPYPQSHYYSNEYSRMVYCWYIDGFFGTQKGVSYINDIIARFKLTVDCQLHSFKSSTIENINPIKLKAFQGLKSLARDKLKEKYQRVETRADDYVFWCLKLYAEDLIRRDGLIIWNTFEKWAFDNFIDLAKDKSTLRGKCRNIYNWYFDNNWKIGRVRKSNKKKEEIMASRVEHAVKLSAKNEEIAKQKVYNAQRLIKYFNEQDGKLSLRAIERQSGCSINTVRKHFIDWGKI
jgi:hypothetical protein